MKKEQVLKKAQDYLIKYSNSTSKYYTELQKNYNEYKNLDSADEVINKLYEKQILRLCRYVEEKENFWFISISLSIIIIVIVLLVGYTTAKLLNSREEVKVVIEKANSEVDLRVGIDDTSYYFQYATDDTYMDINPIIVELRPVSTDNYNIIYDIYVQLLEGNVIDLKDIQCSITINDSTRVFNLEDLTVVLGKQLIYTGNMKLNDTEKVYIRFFTTNKDVANSKFSYKLDFDGYLE